MELRHCCGDVDKQCSLIPPPSHSHVPDPPPHHRMFATRQQRVVRMLETMELPTALMRFKYRIKPPFVLSRLHFVFFLLFRAKHCLCLCYVCNRVLVYVTIKTTNGSA